MLKHGKVTFNSTLYIYFVPFSKYSKLFVSPGVFGAFTGGDPLEFHQDIWHEITARPTALARRSRPGSLQASSDCSPVSERPRTTVSVGALHPGLQC